MKNGSDSDAVNREMSSAQYRLSKGYLRLYEESAQRKAFVLYIYHDVYPFHGTIITAFGDSLLSYNHSLECIDKEERETSYIEHG